MSENYGSNKTRVGLMNAFLRNHQAPKGLQEYLAAVKSDLMDPKNRNKSKYNLLDEETEALKELVKLQKEGVIVIRHCDKGAGIIILDFNEYINACERHLESQTDTGDNYYIKVNETVLQTAQDKVLNIVNEGYDNNILSKEEASAMTPAENVVPGRFYSIQSPQAI